MDSVLKLYKLLKPFEAPGEKINKWKIRTEKGWQYSFPYLKDGGCDMLGDWFELLTPDNNIDKRQQFILDILKMKCDLGKTRKDDCALRTPEYGCIGCRHFMEPETT